MTDDISNLLEIFANQVRNKEYSAASNTADRIAENYERKSANETVLREQATAVAGPDGSDRSNVLREFLTEGFRVEMIRSAFLMSASGLQANPTAVDTGMVADHAIQTKEAENSFNDQLQTASEELAEVTVPGQHAILAAGANRDILPKGEVVTTTATIGNVGDRSIANVSVTLTSSSEFTGEDDIDLGNMEPSSETDVKGHFDAIKSGDGTVTVRAVDGEGDTSTAEVELTVVGKRDALDLARDRVADLLGILPKQDKSKDGQSTAVRKRTRNVRHSLDRAVKALEASNQEQLSGQLDAAEQQATTLRDHLSRSDGSHAQSGQKNAGKKAKDDSSQPLSPDIREQALVQFISIIKLIDLARTAEV